jgi:hypothetical protein
MSAAGMFPIFRTPAVLEARARLTAARTAEATAEQTLWTAGDDRVNAGFGARESATIRTLDAAVAVAAQVLAAARIETAEADAALRALVRAERSTS